jgi:hypothetical protein
MRVGSKIPVGRGTVEGALSPENPRHGGVDSRVRKGGGGGREWEGGVLRGGGGGFWGGFSWGGFLSGAGGRCILFCTALLVGMGRPVGAEESAEVLWGKVVVLDAGPGERNFAVEQTGQVVARHLEAQEQALNAFLSAFPADPRSFEAGLRMARLHQIRADLEGNRKRLVEAGRILGELAKRAVGAQVAEVEFARLAMEMRTLGGAGVEKREQLLGAARSFARRFPDDRRIAALYAEMAVLYADQPRTMRSLLLQAEPLAKRPDLRQRIADDLKRVEWVGKEVPISLRGWDGRTFEEAGGRGGVSAVMFFAAGSPRSRQAAESLKKALEPLPRGEVKVFGVCVDGQLEGVRSLWKECGLDWWVAVDPAGWDSPGVRALGVNSVPSVWLLDRKGRLRSLAGLQGTETQLRQLLSER